MGIMERLFGPTHPRAQLERDNRELTARNDRLCAEIAALRAMPTELDPRLQALLAEYGEVRTMEFLEAGRPLLQTLTQAELDDIAGRLDYAQLEMDCRDGSQTLGGWLVTNLINMREAKKKTS